MKTTYRFKNSKDKRIFSILRSLFALGVVIGIALSLYWVNLWTDLSMTQDDLDYEQYRTPGECCESLYDLKKNYREIQEPIILKYLIAGIIVIALSYIGNEIIKRIIPISKSKTLS